MIEILVGFLIISLSVIFQTAVFGRINLLSGSADIVLIILAVWGLQPLVRKARYWAVMAGLLVGFISNLPWFVPVVVYLVVVELGNFFSRRVWQAPLLTVFSVIFLGTMMMHLAAFLVLQLSGSQNTLSDWSFYPVFC